MKKLVIHIFHVHENAAITGAKLAERIRLVAGERDVALEVFIFGAAIGALADPAQTEFRDALVALAKNGVPVLICQQAVEAIGQAAGVHGVTKQVMAVDCAKSDERIKPRFGHGSPKAVITRKPFGCRLRERTVISLTHPKGFVTRWP